MTRTTIKNNEVFVKNKIKVSFRIPERLYKGIVEAMSKEPGRYESVSDYMRGKVYAGLVKDGIITGVDVVGESYEISHCQNCHAMTRDVLFLSEFSEIVCCGKCKQKKVKVLPFDSE